MYAVLGYSEDYDLAIINIDAVTEHLTVNKGGVSVGEVVYALGSPRGLTGSLSEGIVSSASRLIDGVDYIQITAPVSNGNSGGPLINEYGEVMGANTFMVADGQNLNFAVNISQYPKVDINNGVLAADYYQAVIDKGIIEDESRSGDTDTVQYVPSDVLVNGTLASGDTIDGFSFTLDEAGAFDAILVTGSPNLINSVYFRITDADLNTVAESNIVTNSNGQYREINLNLSAGKYYVLVYYTYDMGITSDYAFALEY
jgi:serine protease Do